MTRDGTGASFTESQSSPTRPFILVKLDYPTGFVRVNGSDRKVLFDAAGGGDEEFFGVGSMGSISLVGESSTLQAQGVELTLTGIPPANIALAFENARGRVGKVWVGFFDSDYVLVEDPILVFSGLIDNSSMDVGEESTVTVFMESRLINWERIKIRRYTNEDQQQRFPGDKFLEFVNQVVEKEILWGVQGEGVPRSQKPTAGETLARLSSVPGLGPLVSARINTKSGGDKGDKSGDRGP